MVPGGDDHDTDEELSPACADCGVPVPPPRHVWLCGDCFGTAQDAGLIHAARALDKDGVGAVGQSRPVCAMCAKSPEDPDGFLSCLPRNLCDRCFRLPWDRP